MEKEITPRIEAEEEVVNIGSKAETETGVELSNFAPTPFELNSKHYESVEGFWQSLKFPEAEVEDGERQKIDWRWTREEVGMMSGYEAKRAGNWASRRLNKLGIDYIMYDGEKIKIGSPKHHDLARGAIREKLEQNPHVLELLLATGEKKITHILRDPEGKILPDSKSLPREIFCKMLMDLREEFRKEEGE